MKKMLGIAIALFLAFTIEDASLGVSKTSAAFLQIGYNGFTTGEYLKLAVAVRGTLADQSLDCSDYKSKFGSQLSIKVMAAGKAGDFPGSDWQVSSAGAVNSGVNCNVKVADIFSKLVLSSEDFGTKNSIPMNVSYWSQGKRLTYKTIELVRRDLKPSISVTLPNSSSIQGNVVLIKFTATNLNYFTLDNSLFNVCMSGNLSCAPILDWSSRENSIADYRQFDDFKFAVKPNLSGSYKVIAKYIFRNKALDNVSCSQAPGNCVVVETQSDFSSSIDRTPTAAPLDDIVTMTNRGSLNLKCNYKRYLSNITCQIKPVISWLPFYNGWQENDVVPTSGSSKYKVKVYYGSNYWLSSVTAQQGQWSKKFTVPNKPWKGGLSNRPYLEVLSAVTDANTANWYDNGLPIGRY